MSSGDYRTMAFAPGRDRKTLWMVFIGLAVVTLGIYYVSIFNGFVWDDDFVIVNNPETRDISSLSRILFSPDVVKPYYRPLNRATYLINHYFFGMNAKWFHAVNIAIHLLNVFSLFMICRKFSSNNISPVLSAFIFALHPINTEAVNFISARNNLLSFLFALTSVLFFLRGEGKNRGWILLSAIFFFLGLLSKETAFMVLVIIAWYTICPRTNTSISSLNRKFRGKFLTLLPYFFCVIVYAIMRLQALDGLFWTGSPTDGMADRLVKNFSTLPRYFGLFLVPTGLTIFHKVPDVTSLNFPLFIIKWTAILSVSILIFSFLVKRLHNQAALFGILWFVANYVPVSNIVAIPSWTMAERYMYIPAAGLCVVTGELIGHLYYQGLYWKRFVMTGVFAIMTLLSVLTVRRNLEWRNEITLFGSAIRNDPASATAHFNMGIALKENGDFAGAKQEWLKTIQIQPDHSDALTQMGTLMAFQGDYQKGEQYYHAALHFDPSNAMAHYNLAKIYEIKGNRAGALAQYELALKYLSVTYKEYRQEIERKVARLRMDGSHGTSK